ncbi:excalibur calcium-binding domain-containing protein [Mycobacterium riyadhense]|uniref:Excalibur calcium-binding domain-containing protein n=1 Tax=Mycobacterium riyadhense TaxID=486698 RepID=A0A1X2AXD9_9MYCO|nr:excalibur calcium-binding domain-containing protein [Mycobacterium riyadhense]MCV7144497.1 excalibur calcium-binding domain-containing protein [Mycobacterium riyadhense]ORW56047.1 hypothetical protein AWC22_07150 [Mycobacterium riyadhense]VTO99448.1 Excalibur calcium-binding domain protein [Mycobacterium riyadhense]
MFYRVATLIAAATATAGFIVVSVIGTPTAPIAEPADINCTQFNEDGSCYWANCTQAKANGECNIPQGSSHYCSKQDRDGDGYACDC